MASVVTINDALFTDGGVDSAVDARLALAASWAHGPNLAVRAGVVWAGVPNLLSGTATTAPSMTVTVQPFHFVGKKTASLEGCYVGSSPATVTLDVAAAPGSNSRIDVVYVMQRDTASTTSPDGVTQAEVGVVTGTAAASPSKPSLPVGAVEVGTVTVASGATNTNAGTVTVATTAAWTAPHGAPIPVRNQTERDALVKFDGLYADRLDLNTLQRCTGTAWLDVVDCFTGSEIVRWGPAAGTAVPAGTPKKTVGASASPTTTAGGAVVIGFTGLTNVVSMVGCPGDSASGLAFVVSSFTNSNASGFWAICYNASGAVIVSSPVRVNVIAVGY